MHYHLIFSENVMNGRKKLYTSLKLQMLSFYKKNVIIPSNYTKGLNSLSFTNFVKRLVKLQNLDYLCFIPYLCVMHYKMYYASCIMKLFYMQ